MSTHVSATAPSTNNQPLYLGLGIGVGGLLLVGIIAIIIQIVRRSRQYNHAHSLDHRLEADAQHDTSETAQVCQGGIPGINDPKTGWTALSSKEDVNEHGVNRRSLIPAFLPKRMKKRGIALRRLKHLSAIVESPRSRHAPSMQATEITAEEQIPAPDIPIPPELERDVFVRPPHIQSWEGLFTDRARAARSVSVNALDELQARGGLHRSMSGNVGPRTHIRSVSLGAEPPARLPPDPMPQPVNTPVARCRPGSSRRVSRDSYSSEGSAGSSVLITSPFLGRRKTRFTSLTSGEQPASLRIKKFANRAVVIQGSHDPQAHAVDPTRASRVSLLNDEERASHGYLVSSSSVSSLEDESGQRPCNIASFRFPLHSAGSPRSSRSKRAQTSIRRVSRFSVSADGSPSGRKRSGVLRDICGNAMPTREHSSASQRSTNSSEGNPFQWDGITHHKPSALKGSPNARKGHRRQNCVRISTLTPQVLGPPPTRPNSPSITHGIQEESYEKSANGLTFAYNRKLPRSNSTGPNDTLRVKTLRASLTPSSPTLSLWATYSDDRLVSQPSDSYLTVSSAGRLSRTGSGISSIYSIPQFPTPGKVTVSEVHHDRPVPEFCNSSPTIRPEHSSSPFALQDRELHSSPPLTWHNTAGSRKRQHETSPTDVEVTSRESWSSRPASTVSLSSNDAARPSSPVIAFHRLGLPRVKSDSSLKLTSENASSSLAHLQNTIFPGAPVLPPPTDDTETPIWQDRRDQRSASPSNHNRGNSRGSPSGPRIEPAKSVSKIAMELRRMNSEVDTTLSRESRRYLRFDREASPVLPLFDSPNPNGSCNSLFDFGFDENSANPAWNAKQTVSTESQESGWSKRTPQQGQYPKRMSPRERLRRNRMVPGTPSSLYDADGFLRP